MAKKLSRATKWSDLNSRIAQCTRCPRLISHCQSIAEKKRRAYMDWDYWGRPVPNFGLSNSPLLIVGLAPAAHGANRTGRMFTGDRSGDWLFRAMHRAGFASQSNADSIDDGLRLKKCVITAACHCAPPDNKPTIEEIAQCQPFLMETIELLKPRVYLALGGLGWKSITRFAVQNEWIGRPQPKFSHGAVSQIGSVGQHDRWLVGSYHPSQQNTFTGRLTEKMFDEVFEQVKKLLDA